MSRLTDIASQLERNAANFTAPAFLRKLDEHYTLRRLGRKREKKQVLDDIGNPVKNCYFPHLAITATCYARTWKMLEDAKKVFGYEGGKGTSNNGEVWEDKLLLACEHIVRWLKHDIDDAEMQTQIRRLVNPLPKSEYLNRKQENTKEGEGQNG